MSLHAMIAVLDAPPQREHSDRLVMIEFGNEAGSDGANCRPGKKTISDNSGVSQRTVTDCIDRLESDGWVWVHHRGRGRVNHYVLLLPGLKEIVPSSWSCKTCLAEAQAYRDDLEAGRRSPYPRHATPHDGPVDNQTAPVDDTQKQGDARPTAPVDNPSPESREVGRPASPTRATGVPKQGDRSPMTRMTRLDPDTLADGSAAGGGGDDVDNRQLFTAIAQACRLDGDLTGPAAAVVGKTAKQLAKVNATPAQVAARSRRLVDRWGDKALTPTSLAKHWPSLAPPARDGTSRGDPDREAQTLAANYATMPWDHVEEALRSRGFHDDVIADAHDTWHRLQQGDAA